MNGAAAALFSLWRGGFPHPPSQHRRHRDNAIAQRLIDAAIAQPAALLKQLGTTPAGLTVAAAAQRLSALGPNLVAHERRQSFLRELVGRARNPLNFLLLSLAALSYFLGDKRAAAAIAVMVLLSVSLASMQEHRSNNAAAKLRAMVRTTATVLRRATSGERREHGISAVPVVDAAGSTVGMVNEGDLIGRDEAAREARLDWWLSMLAEGEPLSADFLDSVRSAERRARDVMTAPVITVGEETEIDEIARLLTARRIKRVPVLRHCRIVGIVGRADLVRALAEGKT